MISRKMINIFRGVCAEYGNKEAIRRMKNILNLNMSDVVDETIAFMPNFIMICCENPVTIFFEDGYYFVKREYEKYDSYVFYDDVGLAFRQTTSFKTKDGKRLVVDSMDSEQIKNTRIIKTTEDDRDFNHGYYEKEMMSTPNAPINENSIYIEYSNDDNETSKIISVVDNMYYYHQYSVADNCQFLEAAACIDTPKLLINGRTRMEKDLLFYSERTKLPNIFMRGNVVNEYKSTTHYYDLSIYKLPRDGVINIQIDMISQVDGSLDHKSYNIKNCSRGPISRKDILTVIRGIIKLGYPFTMPVIEELTKIEEELGIHKQESLKDIDIIDLEMLMHQNHGDLAFHIYENLGSIDAFIESQTTRKLEEEPQKSL